MEEGFDKVGKPFTIKRRRVAGEISMYDINVLASIGFFYTATATATVRHIGSLIGVSKSRALCKPG